jgi:hypothetical protein
MGIHEAGGPFGPRGELTARAPSLPFPPFEGRDPASLNSIAISFRFIRKSATSRSIPCVLTNLSWRMQK